MADKDRNYVYPLPQSNGGNAKFDEESVTWESQDLRKKKRIYFAAFVVFQTAIILLFALTIMKVRTPKFRVFSATLEGFPVGTTENPNFSLKINVELGVKNNNFGDYEFQNSKIYFLYNDSIVGGTAVPKSEVGIRATKKLNVIVEISSNNPQLRNDLNTARIITLKSQSKLRGKVELIRVLKKKKSANMDCTLTIVVADRAVREISCK